MRMIRKSLVFAVLITISVGTVHAKRPVTLNDLQGVVANKTVIGTTLDLSADGRWIAVEHGHRLQVVDVGSRKIVQELGEGLVPRWSPKADRLAFYSSRSGALQLWVWNADTRQARQLTDFRIGVDPDPNTRVMGVATDALRLSWSADGTQVVFTSRVGVQTQQREPVEGAPLILNNATPANLTLTGIFSDASMDSGIAQIKDGRTWGHRAAKKGEILFSQLFVVDINTLEVKQITAGSRSFFHPAWSPIGQAIVCAATGTGNRTGARPDTLTDSLKEGEIIAIDPSTGTQRVLASGAGVKYRPIWSADGGKIAYLAGAATFEDPRIHVVSYEEGKEQPGIQIDRKIAEYAWSEADDELFVLYDDGGTKFGRFRSGSYASTLIKSQEVRSGIGVWSHARDGSLAWVEGFAGSRVWFLPARARQPVQLIELDKSIDELDLGPVVTVSWHNKQGEELHGKLLYPPGGQPGRKYPVIVDAYPLGGGSTWMHPMAGNQTWAAAGYAVFKPMPRAPHVWMNCSGPMQYCRASKGPAAWDVMVDDVISGVDELIRQDVIDGDRMCLYGHSNGASTVSYLVTRTTRFKCAIAVASSMTDWISPAVLSTEDWTEYMVGVSMWKDPAAYVKLSAIFHVDKVKTPMLLVAGDRDGGFLLGTIRMYNALRHAGAEVTMLRYPEQGHLFIGAAMQDLWKRQMAFFDRYLKPGRMKGAPRTSTDRPAPPRASKGAGIGVIGHEDKSLVKFDNPDTPTTAPPAD